MERMAIPALEMGGYHVERQVDIGFRFGVGRHRIDTLARGKDSRLHLISMKWQQVAGTAEQKVPFEVMSLAEARLRHEEYYSAYLVLGGEGWKYKNFYLSGGLRKYLTNADLVNIVSLENFVAIANQGQL